MLTKSLSHLPLTPAVHGELDSVINCRIVEEAINIVLVYLAPVIQACVWITQGIVILFDTVGNKKLKNIVDFILYGQIRQQ